MALVLFGFWMLLNARWTVEVAAVGAVLSALEYLLLYQFFGYSPRKEWQFLRRLPGFLAYAAFLNVEHGELYILIFRNVLLRDIIREMFIDICKSCLDMLLI